MPPVEHHILVKRTARYFVLGELGDHTRELWIACHGYGQLAQPFAAALEPVVSESRAVIAPEALSRFYLDEPTKKHGPDSPVGAAWMTATDRQSDINDYVAYLDAVAGALAADLPRDRGARVFNGAPVVMLAGRQDTLVPVKFMQKERRSLEDRGVAVEFIEYDGAHSLNSETLRRLAVSS